MTSLLTLIRRGLRALGREAKRDDGVLALVIAIALIAIAAGLIAATARQTKEAEVARLSGNAKNVKLLKNSIVAYYLSAGAGPGGINGQIVCPDTSSPPNGTADGTTSCTATTGVVPWVTLGLSEDDAVDSYGNYFTYAVSGSADSRSVCTYLASDLDSSQSQYTGTLNEVTDTEVRLSNQAADQGAPYYYAFVSHGKNGSGAIAKGGGRRANPTSAAEQQNCSSLAAPTCTDSEPLVLYSGPANKDDDSSYFDDTVFAGSNSQLEGLCESLTPGGGANADLKEDFSNTPNGDVPDSLAGASGAGVQNSTRPGNTSNRVLRLGAGTAGANVRTNILTFDTAERARYVTFEWAPTELAATTAGISIATRATPADRSTTTTVGGYTADLFAENTDDGLTFRFYEDVGSNVSASNLNRIYICDDTNVAGCNNGGTYLARSSDQFSIEINQAYTVEAYDDGVQVWARITQVDDPTNTAFAQLNAPAARQDLAGFNAIGFINYTSTTTEIDELLVGRGSLGLYNDSTGTGIVETSSSAHVASPDATLEAWIKPETLPETGERAAIISKWIQGGSDSDQAYRLSLLEGGRVAIDLASATTVATPSLVFPGFSAKVGQWDHLAVVYSSDEESAKLYVNRELISRVSVSSLGGDALNSGTADFTVGAERNSGGTVVNAFHGTITDVRVWNSVRTASEIFANYNRRIALNEQAVGDPLVVNWTLDSDTSASVGSSTTQATPRNGAGGTIVSGARYAGIYQRHIPAFSTTFCGSGVKLNPYQCEFRSNAQSRTLTIPDTLGSVFVKAWGGGGGGYLAGAAQSGGGGGGFSAARITTIGGESVAGLTNIRVDVGGGGAGSPASANGAGGGGASGLWQDNLPFTTVSLPVSPADRFGIIAGGGGGASYGDENVQGANINCTTAGACGPGGGGGGPGNIAALGTSVDTVSAPDSYSVSDLCGGRGGDNAPSSNPPPDSTYCSEGGLVATNLNQGGGPTTGTVIAGGLSSLSPGGRGQPAGAEFDYDPDGLGPIGTETFNTMGSGGGGGGITVNGTGQMIGGGGQSGAYGAEASLDLTGFIQAVLNLDITGILNILDVRAFLVNLLGGANDNFVAGYGGGGGSGFADTNALSTSGESGTATASTSTAGGTTDDEYCAPVNNYYIANPTDGLRRPLFSDVADCTSFPARGGIPTATTGRDGAVVIKW